MRFSERTLPQSYDQDTTCQYRITTPNHANDPLLPYSCFPLTHDLGSLVLSGSSLISPHPQDCVTVRTVVAVADCRSP